MMAVEIATQPSLLASKLKVLFEGQYQPSPGTFSNYTRQRRSTLC